MVHIFELFKLFKLYKQQHDSCDYMQFGPVCMQAYLDLRIQYEEVFTVSSAMATKLRPKVAKSKPKPKPEAKSTGSVVDGASPSQA